MSNVRFSLIPYNHPKPTPDNLPAFVPYACALIGSPFSVRFTTVKREEYVSKAEDKNKIRRKSVVPAQLPVSDSKEDSVEAVSTLEPAKNDEIVVSAVVDASERLVGLAMERCHETPRLLMQVIGLCVPFCSSLTSLSLRQCTLDGTVLYEIGKFLPQSQITDLCLDDSPVCLGRCYYKLLEGTTKLRNLSLARCNLTDDDIALLVQKLTHPMPASKTLLVLNLTNNFISNLGARSIGECLRTNRTLQYLNLAGNQISDKGAKEIIDTLAYFPLTADEILKKRRRFMEYLKMRQDVFSKFQKELGNVTNEKSVHDSIRFSKHRGEDAKVKPSTNVFVSMQRGKRSAKDIVVGRAQAMAEEFVGNYYDPFCTEETFCQDDYIYCTGNMSLCYLNLSYNNLSYMSLKKLVKVVKYQGNVLKNVGTGLLQVYLQGNNMPECGEAYILQDWLDQAVMMRTTSTQSPRRQVKTKK